MPLRASDAALLQDLARYDGLPRISENDSTRLLVRLTTEVAAAVRHVRAVTGASASSAVSSARDNGRQGRAIPHRIPRIFHQPTGCRKQLARLAAEKAAEPGKIAVSDALADRVGLAERLADLGGSAAGLAS